MDSAIAQHCTELERCNQRGGRMLSILDLLDANTLELDLAAYLTARVTRGASVMVGANPGGAGKTTVMCALLNLLPADVQLVPATPRAVHQAAGTPPPKPQCYICHEIGDGPYYAYLWGRDLRTYCALQDEGYLLGTNLHADDIDEARAQVCGDNRVPEPHFNAFDLVLFLWVRGNYGRRNRRIAKVYASEGAAPHKLVYEADKPSPLPADPWQDACAEFLEAQHATGERTIEAVRRSLVEFLGRQSDGSV